ncbi:MAG: hypothetical protein ACK6DP_05780 [Gemmatimonas sp.]|jgi:hypothetical protein|uniref:hypothetical protein n=1 Tax=Gemmatimonas sp. TaxID=1962908 RepID=UPI00391EF885|nr:hypothetical protein [Gemmatimonadota bacterium]
MPRVAFDALPNTARLWVFSAAGPVTGAAAEALLTLVDGHLDRWRAHGVPLVCARDWRDHRFLAIGVDEAATGASGCSIDALFHALRDAEREVGTSLVDSARLFWRDADGVVQGTDRPGFRAAGAAGVIATDTPVFDTTVETVGAWRTAFEKPARESWQARLLPPR